MKKVTSGEVTWYVWKCHVCASPYWLNYLHCKAEGLFWLQKFAGSLSVKQKCQGVNCLGFSTNKEKRELGNKYNRFLTSQVILLWNLFSIVHHRLQKDWAPLVFRCINAVLVYFPSLSYCTTTLPMVSVITCKINLWISNLWENSAMIYCKNFVNVPPAQQ
jgi:hypothetical protein